MHVVWYSSHLYCTWASFNRLLKALNKCSFKNDQLLKIFFSMFTHTWPHTKYTAGCCHGLGMAFPISSPTEKKTTSCSPPSLFCGRYKRQRLHVYWKQQRDKRMKNNRNNNKNVQRVIEMQICSPNLGQWKPVVDRPSNHQAHLLRSENPLLLPCDDSEGIDSFTQLQGPLPHSHCETISSALDKNQSLFWRRNFCVYVSKSHLLF